MEAIDRRQRMTDATNAFAEDVARAIKARREKLRWSQEILALEAGVSREAVRLVEGGKGAPNLKTVYRLARAMGHSIRIKDLLGEVPRGIPVRNGDQRLRQESIWPRAVPGSVAAAQ